MNRYPLWKYIIIVVAVFFGALYTLPNFFPRDPAVQVSSIKSAVKVDSALLAQVQTILKEANIAHSDGFIDPVGIMLKLPDTDTQMHARDVLQAALGEDDYVVALNTLSSAPSWLEFINAKPMNLGLDLRGGVHFLLQVDMRGALDKAADRYSTDLRSMMRDRRIQNRGVAREGHTVVLRFRDAQSRDAARVQINRQHPELLLTPRGEGDDLQLVASLRAEEQKRIQDNAIIQNMATLRNRVNELGVAEPIVQQAGADRIVVQLPGVQDTARAKSIIGRTATLEIRMVNETPGALEAALRGQVPHDSDLFFEERHGGAPILIYRQVVLTGDRINDAQPGFTDIQQPSVNVNLDSVGQRIFRDVTRENVGKRMAIMLVERNQTEVITAPVIREEIGGGRVQISGAMTSREANDIALLMRAGALAAPMEIIEERTVGPSLGQENIEKGFNSVLGGFIALILFIVAYYRVMGMVSAVCLTVNLMLLVALLSALQATLTLPGIAAMALTLGISIDANVLINERIREELRWGAPPHTAISAGYERAWNTILDSNVTNLIAGLSLFLFGSGPVKGFAVVHCLGILTSIFSAVFVSRGIVSLIYGRKKKLDSISVGQVWKPSTDELSVCFVAPDGVRSLKADKRGSAL